MISLTAKANEKIKEFAESEGLFLSIRAKVIGGGCAGFEFDLYFDDKVNDLDEVITIDSIQIIVDGVSAQYLEDATIDFVEAFHGSGFKFILPNAKGSCGCGSSFSF